MNTITIGVDLAKSLFTICETQSSGRVLRRRDLHRDAFATWLAQQPAGTVIAMEACSGAHHWARRCLAHGLVPRLMAAQFVKPFCKSQLAKNDANDAEAMTGIGPLTADAMVASIGSARDFKNGRQLAAWLGLVPSQHSSGGRARLGTISCRGDAYLRTLLIQGARSSLQRAKTVTAAKATPEQAWIRALAGRLPFGKVLVAIANKHARQLWVMLAHDVDYDPNAFSKHPLQPHTTTA